MKKKKILVLTPDTPDPSYIESVVSPLEFLSQDYTIHALDSLSIMEDVPKDSYYRLWAQELIKHMPHYDAFFGFSFGGVILQQCFPVFANVNKPIVLFSTPTFANEALAKKLGQVISLCERHEVYEGLNSLYQYVYHPNPIPLQSHKPLNIETAAKRVIFGLSRVLETDSTSVLLENEVNHLHLIGEESQLVNKDNVIAPRNGTLLRVPNAGMRMLRDNPSFCSKAILEVLNGKT